MSILTGTFTVTKNDYSKNTIDGLYTINNSHTHKIYHGDIVNWKLETDQTATIVNLKDKTSNLRTAQIPVIIDINALKRYGYTKNNVPIYLAKPNIKYLPKLFVSTKIKKKMKPPYKNQLAVVKITSWDKEYPTAKITRILGNCDDDDAYQTLLLYTYNLYNKKTKLSKDLILDINKFDLTNYIDKTKSNIFSIDPPKTLDIDDAVEIVKLPDNNYEISVYIADPTAFISYYNNEKFNNSIINKMQTIYTINRNYPMIPEELSNDFCSLLPGKKRLSLSFSIIVDKMGNLLPDTHRFQTCLIINKKAYSYKKAQSIIEKSIIYSNPIVSLFHITNKIAKKNYPKIFEKEWDTHKMIETLMVMTNTFAAKFILENISKLDTKPIFRRHETPTVPIPDKLTDKTTNIIKWIGMKSAKYTTDISLDLSHYGLGIDLYTHFTSPIRRFTDLITHYLIKKILYNKKLPKEFTINDTIITNLNENMKNSRRLSLDLEMMKLCNMVYEIPEKMLTTSVCVVDFWDDGIIIFSEKLNMRFYHKLINSDLEDLFSLNSSDDNSTISIIDNKTNKSTCDIKKYSLIDMELYYVTSDNLKNRLITKLLV